MMLLLFTSGLALGGCGSSGDAALAQIFLLGEASGPTTADAADFIAGTCGTDCDNDIEALGAGAGRSGELIAGVDDDFTALASTLIWLAWGHAGVDFMYEKLELYLIDVFGGPTDGEVAIPALSGSFDLGALCASGSAFGTYRTQGTVVIETGKGELDVSYPLYIDTFHLILSGCIIEGDLTDEPGSERITLSGMLTVVNAVSVEDDLNSVAVTGQITVNPGVASAGEDASVIWGGSVPLAIDAEAEFLTSAGGGFCYDGATPTAEGCEGLFLSTNDEALHDVLYLPYEP